MRSSLAFPKIDTGRHTGDDPGTRLNNSALYLRQLLVKLINRLAERDARLLILAKVAF